MSKLTIRIEGIGALPLLRAEEISYDEYKLTFIREKLSPLEATRLSDLFNTGNDKPVTARISYPDGRMVTFNFNIRVFCHIANFDVWGRCLQLTVDVVPIVFEPTKPELPEHLSVVVGSNFLKFMVDRKVTAGETLEKYKTFGWTEQMLIDEKQLVRKTVDVNVTYEPSKFEISKKLAEAQALADREQSFADFINGIISDMAIDLGVTEHMLKQTLEEWANGQLGEHWVDKKAPKQPQTIEFTDIKDNLDFMELVEKFADDYSLRGGQKTDGAWFLNGVHK